MGLTEASLQEYQRPVAGRVPCEGHKVVGWVQNQGCQRIRLLTLVIPEEPLERESHRGPASLPLLQLEEDHGVIL
jgi:hypothetical protein